MHIRYSCQNGCIVFRSAYISACSQQFSLNDKLDDNDDIRRQVKALYTRGNILVNNFNKCSQQVKNCLFKSYCSNCYGGQLWSIYKKDVYKKCVVAYNDIYRKLFNIKRGESISAVYANNKIDSFNTIIRKDVFRFRNRTINSKNILISAVLESSFYNTCSNITKKWNNILYTFNM